LRAFIQYLNTGLLVITEEDRNDLVESLNSFARQYQVDHLAKSLLPFAEAETSFDEQMAEASRVAASAAVQSMSELLHCGHGATMNVLFCDPHTAQQCTHAVHPYVLMGACPLFYSLLKPITEGIKSEYQFEGITAKASGRSSRRGIIVGPVTVPMLSVKHLLHYLYTGVLDVPPEAALTTMLGAQALRLSHLQAHCEAVVAREEVNFSSCSHFITLAAAHNAQMLLELSQLTAALGLPEVSKTQGFQLLSPEEQREIERVAQELKGSWVSPPPVTTEQKSPNVYAARLSIS
jgi:hypothetical protein